MSWVNFENFYSKRRKVMKRIIFTVLLLFSLSFLSSGFVNAQEQLMSSKRVIASIQKTGTNYQVESLLLNVYGAPYARSFDQYKKDGIHNGRVVSFSGKDLGFFPAAGIIPVLCTDSVDSQGNFTGGCKEVENGPVSLDIPWFPNAKYAEIFDPAGNLVLKIDIFLYAVCNENGQCDSKESYQNCPGDCEKSLNQNQPIEQQPQKKISWLLVMALAIFFLVIAIGSVIYIRWRRVKNLIE
jgi:hypothetical protein